MNNKKYEKEEMTGLYCIKKVFSIFFILLTLSCMILSAAIITFKITGLRLCTVDGHSMDNTLYDGEKLILNPSAEPGFGDIIVFHYDDFYLIKRIIGLPGDTVTVVKGTLYINNIKYDETYLSPECISAFKDSSFAIIVNEDEYFVMGDNRDNSRDGRSFGCIPKDSVLGVAIWHF